MISVDQHNISLQGLTTNTTLYYVPIIIGYTSSYEKFYVTRFTVSEP